MNTADSILLCEDREHIRILTLNRPQSRNALSDDLIAALSQALSDTAASDDIRAVIIAGNGAAFCAGHDLREVQAKKGDNAAYQDLFNRCSQMMMAITRIPQPVIAAAHGIATAAGCQLVASCDLAVATASAKFATPGVHIGLFCSTPMVSLSRNVNHKTAMKMLLTGAPIDAESAKQAGLINDIADDDNVVECALSLARIIAEKSPRVVAIGKEAFYHQINLSLEDAYAYANDVMSHNMSCYDAQEGIEAFIEKRRPVWRGK